MSLDQAAWPPVMQYLPQGATLHSLATFLHRSCGARSGNPSCLRYYGLAKYQLELGNPTGQGAQHLAKNFLGGKPSGAELIRRHTVMGLYGPVMSKFWWGNQLVAEIAEGAQHAHCVSRKLVDGPLSWCPDCSKEDFDRYGWAPWRVVHQVPYAHHCPEHGTALLSLCSRCNEPLGYGFRWRLPGDACRICKGSLFRPAFVVEQSSGYQRLLRVLLWLNRAMTSNEPMPTIKSAPRVRWSAAQEKLLRHSLDQLSAEWALPDVDASIPKQLGVREMPSFLLMSKIGPECASPLANILFASLGPEFA